MKAIRWIIILAGMIWEETPTSAQAGAVEVEFAEVRSAVGESAGTNLIQVVRHGVASGAFQVDYVANGGTARVGEDYLLGTGTVAFAPGETNKTLSLPILDDFVSEADEAVSLALVNPTAGAQLGSNAVHSLVILDNERPGTRDTTFNSEVTDNGQFPGLVYALALQSDGRLLIGGHFTHVGGLLRPDLARLLPDGSADATFLPPMAGGLVLPDLRALALQPDGKVVLSIGDFGAGMLRLETNGAVDAGFNVSFELNSGTVRVVVIEPSGKILIGGKFSTVNGVARKNIARLNSDGSLDSGFDPGSGLLYEGGAGFDLAVAHALLRQPDGKVVVGGRFTHASGVAATNVARLNGDGSPDAAFGPSPFLDGEVSALAQQNDGQLLVGGRLGSGFEPVPGLPSAGLVRLRADGRLDPYFTRGDTGAAIYGPPQVNAIARQPDGRILVAGYFENFNGTLRSSLAQLNVDGSLDHALTPEFGGLPIFVQAMTLQPDGQLIVAGGFISSGSSFLVRLNGGASAFEFLSVERLALGTTRLRFQMPRGQSFRLETTDDPWQWTPLQPPRTFVNESEFLDTDAVRPRRFYRGVLNSQP